MLMLMSNYNTIQKDLPANLRVNGPTQRLVPLSMLLLLLPLRTPSELHVAITIEGLV